MFGFRQSGETELILADLAEDINILKVANSEAKRIIEDDSNENMVIKKEILNKLEMSKNYICYN